MMDRSTVVAGVEVPRFFYGTAWKEEKTEHLTALALRQGFRAIDTANQRKHYHEVGVGRAVASAIADGMISRKALFLQSKFTYQRGQDHRLPYDPDAPLADQVAQSFERSCQHLQTDYLDSFVLHGPSSKVGINDDDWAVWRAMEDIQTSGRARLLGVSNIALDQLKVLCDGAAVAPRFVQNRCYASTGWDYDMRAFCRQSDIIYQGFSLLTANQIHLKNPALIDIRKRLRMSINQIIFAFALARTMVPLTGTSNADHMKHDLAVFEHRLSEEDVLAVETLAKKP